MVPRASPIFFLLQNEETEHESSISKFNLSCLQDSRELSNFVYFLNPPDHMCWLILVLVL